MTDRSSEERSRANDAAMERRAALWMGGYVCGSLAAHMTSFTENELRLAALEDRQEAAPEISKALCDAADHLQAADGPPMAGLDAGEAYDWAANYLRVKARSLASGIPSEATPSKENAPLPVPTYFVTHPYGSYSIADPAAPAPEVQGTPRSLGKLIHDATIQKGEEFAVTGEELDTICAATQGPHPAGTMLFCGKNLRVESPVGTPQKETPPAKCPYCDFNEGLGHAKFCRNYQVTRGSSMPYGADAQNFGVVPEGVQGKEPQTFDEFWAIKQPFDGDSPVGAKFWARKSWAAGRRSAITELQETVADWGRRSRDAFFVEACVWCLKKCAELQEKTK